MTFCIWITDVDSLFEAADDAACILRLDKVSQEDFQTLAALGQRYGFRTIAEPYEV